MTLQEVIRAIETAARLQPSVAMVVPNDIFRLNTLANARYGVFAWTQGRHRVTYTEDWRRYSFTLFYVDRLRNDKANEIEAQSVGMETLTNILRTLDGWGISPETYEFQTFNQRFSDECAGVFCSVIFLVSEDAACPEEYGDPDAISAFDGPLRTSDDLRLLGSDGNAYVLKQTGSEVQAALDAMDAPNAAQEQPLDGMLPNVLYTLGTLSGSVVFRLAPALDGSRISHWFWTFDTGASVPSVTWPSEIRKWNGGSAPEMEPNRHYEVSVLGGVAAFMEV